VVWELCSFVLVTLWGGSFFFVGARRRWFAFGSETLLEEDTGLR
jgi:hypothetical protein